ncbi:MAG: PH domain-containing protein [Methylococcales bacterium]|nr:PH domain-containing protein [Methylococcales bacterium]
MKNEDHIYNNAGLPFVDRDSAFAKARIITREVGVEFFVIKCDGGYAVTMKDNSSNEQKVKKQSNNDLMEKPSEKETIIQTEKKEPVEQELARYLAEMQSIIPEQATFDDQMNDNHQTTEKKEPSEESSQLMQENKTDEHEIKPLKPMAKENIKADKSEDKGKNEELKLRPSLRKFFSHYIVLLASFVAITKPEIVFLPFLTTAEIMNNKILVSLFSTVELVGWVALLIAIYKIVVPIISNRYTITSDAVETKIGFISKDLASIFIADIRTADLSKTIFDRVLDVGTIRLKTSGTAGTDIILWGIGSPEIILDKIRSRQTRTTI